MSFLSQVPELKYALGISGLLSFYGVVTVIMYFLPVEKWGYDNTHKIVVIALILLTLPIVLVIALVASRRSKKEAKAEADAKAAEEKGSEQQKLAKPIGNYDEITQAAEGTVQFLKSSNLGGGKDAVYELPWYLVIGNPKSGKSSLSLASGLNFQTLPSQRQSEQKFIRPTRNVDWRVTSDAVFLDTAGRYQLEGADQDEWSGLIETLKKYRGNRPLDGMIVTINAERILQSEDNDIEQIAKVLRARIDETIQRTKIRFPIYLVFTHADSIEGFRDSFSNSQKEGQNLVWGATIPIEKSENAHTLFDGEFDLLQNSVMKRRLMRLSAPFPPVRQLKIFNFPLHFGAARKKLGHFVSNLFRPNPFSESPFLRGFYFTAVPVNRPKIDGAQTMTNVGGGQTVGQSYFTQKLFRDVILRDKDLVASILSQKVSPPIMGWIFTFISAILVFSFLLGAAISLYKNKVLVETASVNAVEVLSMVKGDQNRSPLAKTPEEASVEIDKIEALHKSLVELDKYEREWAPLYKWFGLYSGNRIYHEKLLPIYYNVIEQRYKKPIVKKLESDLRAFSANANNQTAPNQQEIDVLDKNFDLFRAYLMLSKEQVNPNLPDLGTYRSHAESTILSVVLKPYMLSESKIPEAKVETASQQLEFYFQQIKRDEFPSIKLDASLVEATRKKLQAYPAWAQYYKRVTTDISNKVQPINADSILAGKGGNRGVLTSSYTVQGAYTIDGYRKHMIEAINKAPDELDKDDWVMGGKANKGNVDPQAVKNIEDKYYKDYVTNWKKFISGINVPGYKDKDTAINALQVFSDVNSPIKTLLEEVSRQTNFSAEPKSQGWSDYIWSLLFSPQNDKKDKTLVETEFDALFKFTESKEDKTSEISQYGGFLQEILRCSNPDCNIDTLELTQITTQVQEGKGGFVSKLNNVDKNINSVADKFKANAPGAGAAGPDIAALLRKPLGNLMELVGGGIKDKIIKEWGEVLAKSKTAEKGYPFNNNGETDVKELTKYLNPVNGTLTEFYKNRLSKYFDGDIPNLKVKESSEVKFTDDFVKYLNNAFRLRDLLFGKDNATINYTYGLELKKINDALIEVKIDGQLIDTNTTGSKNFAFSPGKDGETGAFMNFASTADPTTSKTPTPSANSSSPNVSGNNTPTGVQDDSGSGSISFPGAWGLLHFFDRGGGASTKQPDGKYVLSFKIRGKTVTAVITPTGGDLFDRNMFAPVQAPETIIVK